MAKRKAGRAAKEGGTQEKGERQERRQPARSRPPARPPAGRRSCAGGRRAGSKAKTARKATAARKKTAAKVKRAPAKRTASGRQPPKSSPPEPRRAKRRDARRRRSRRPLRRSTWTAGASAARTGRAEMAEARTDHANMTPAITGGDVDADVEDAYFSGDEAPAATTRRRTRTSSTTSARRSVWNTRTTRSCAASDKVADARQAPLGARSGVRRRLPGPEVSAARLGELVRGARLRRALPLTDPSSPRSTTVRDRLAGRVDDRRRAPRRAATPRAWSRMRSRSLRSVATSDDGRRDRRCAPGSVARRRARSSGGASR